MDCVVPGSTYAGPEACNPGDGTRWGFAMIQPGLFDTTLSPGTSGVDGLLDVWSETTEPDRLAFRIVRCASWL